MSNVLVTGGGGFLAGWTTRKLLEQGHTVCATFRSEASSDVVKAMLGHEGVDLACYSHVLADLTEPDGWDEAMTDIDYVLHIASPLGGESHDDPALIDTARDGTLHVVNAAITAGVDKIVMTSSAAAVFPGRGETRQDIDETFWTDLDDKLVTNYMRSKTVAEHAAWDAIARQDHTKLVTILPGAIFGPFMDGRHSSTDLLFTTILRGTSSPKATYFVVDVRDLADLHILAMTNAAADGERFIAEPGEITMPAMARLMKERLGEHGTKIRTTTVPDFVVRLGSRFVPALAVMNTMVGMKYRHANQKAADRLGWTPRPVEATVLDTAEYLIAHDLT